MEERAHINIGSVELPMQLNKSPFWHECTAAQHIEYIECNGSGLLVRIVTAIARSREPLLDPYPLVQ